MPNDSLPLFTSSERATVAQLTSALKLAQAAHHTFEKGLGHADPDWAQWYARYIVANFNLGYSPE